MISKNKYILLTIFLVAFSFEDAIETYNYAVHHHKNGNLENAKSVYNKLLSNKDSNISFRSSFNLGCIYIEEKKYDSAMKCFEKAMLINSSNYEAKYNYVYAKLKQQSIINNTEKPSNTEDTKSTSKIVEKNIASEHILNIIKVKEQETKNKYFNNLQIETPKSKNPW